MNTNKSAVACLIYSADKTSVCLIKRRDVPVWVLTGGGVDPGEKEEVAACREAQEELGTPCNVKRLVGVYLPKNKLSRKTHLFELRSLEEIIDRPTEETLGVKFFPIHQLPAMPPPYKAWIEDGLQVPEGVINYSFVPGVHWGNFIKLSLLHPLKVLRFILSRLGMHWNS
jgi:8-oxo-dGTP pyrophosphatase MutT (NUDIX family)